MGEKETIERLEQKIKLLEGENEKLLLAEGYLQQNNENLKSAIGQSISELREVEQNLLNTRTFLGKSKTIKEIRDNIEKIRADLWMVVYPDRPFIPQGFINPSKPWPRPTKGYNPDPDYPPPSGPPPPHDPPGH